MKRWKDSRVLQPKAIKRYPLNEGDIVLVHDRKCKWYAEVVDVLGLTTVVSRTPRPLRKKEPDRRHFVFVDSIKLERVWPR